MDLDQDPGELPPFINDQAFKKCRADLPAVQFAIWFLQHCHLKCVSETNTLTASILSFLFREASQYSEKRFLVIMPRKSLPT